MLNIVVLSRQKYIVKKIDVQDDFKENSNILKC